MEERILKDLIVLGRAAPDEMKDGRQAVCVGGWSDELGFIRLYPANIHTTLNRWKIIEVPVERNPKDVREESWKIEGSKMDWSQIHHKVTTVGELTRTEKIELLNKIPKVNCIEDLNDSQKSLGIIIPKEIISCEYEERKKYDPRIQTKLYMFTEGPMLKDNPFLVKTKKNYPMIPIIKWKCPGPCKLKQGYHKSQVITLEVYEWFRKHGVSEETKRKLWDNLRICDDEYDKWFFVGNQNNYRRSFLLISILRFKRKLKR